jgi:hypothetical protein
MRALALAVVIGCTHPAAPPPTTPPAPTGPDCVTALAHAPDLLTDNAEQRDQLRTMLVGHCDADHWTVEARACIAQATSHDALHDCARHHLTVDQHDRVGHDIMAIVGAHPGHHDQAGQAGSLSVTSIEPDKGDVAGGTYVRVAGSDFLADGPRNLKIYFGSRQGTVVRFASDGELIAEALGGRDGETVDVLLIFEPGGELKLPHAFTFIDKTPMAVAPPPSGATQAQIAAQADAQGVKEMTAGNYPEASAKFRDAAARVPEAGYFVHLCSSLYHEGKFAEGLTACGAARKQSPSAAQQKLIDKQEKQIKDEAKRQQIQLDRQ